MCASAAPADTPDWACPRTPIGLPHTFSNGGAGRLRFLLTISPARHLAYFEAVAQLMQAAGGRPDPQAMIAVMQRWGLEPVCPAS